MDLSNLTSEEALKVFLQHAVVYTDTEGSTRKMENFGDVVDFWGDKFEELEKSVGRENMFIYSMNDYDYLLEGYRWANIYCRFITTTYFKLPADGIEI